MGKKKSYTKKHHELFSTWIAKEKKAKRAGKRKYLHFDPYIDIYKRTAFFKEYLSNKKNIEKHSFYPLIRSSINTPKVKWVINEDGSKRREWLPKKKRQIFYASHFDAFIYSWYATVLTDLYEKKLVELEIEEIPIAYRSLSKCNIDFAKDAFDYISQNKDCVSIALDFSKFFDSLDHKILKNKWCELINSERLPEDHYKIFKNVTNFTFIDNDETLARYFPFIKYKSDHPKNKRITTTEEFRYLRKIGLIKKNPFLNRLKNSNRINQMCGIPQGLPISAALCNIYLLDFDRLMSIRARKNNAFYRRYSDDILYICPKSVFYEDQKYIEQLTKQFELTLNSDKTDITEYRFDNEKLSSFCLHSPKRKSMQYLGFEFNGEKIFLRSSSVGRYHRKMRAGIRETVKRAFGKNSKRDTIFISKALKKYTHFGKNNFISYSKRASKLMNSESIAKQNRNNVSKMKSILKQKAENRKKSFSKRNKKIKPTRFFQD